MSAAADANTRRPATVSAYGRAVTGQPDYLTLNALLALIDEPNGPRVRALLDDHRRGCAHAPGSSANHQAWPGGFWDHTREVLNLAVVQYRTLSACRPLPFSLSDALLVLAVHDLEKLVRYRPDGSADPSLAAKADKAAFRLKLLDRYQVKLTGQQANALRYAEGVRDRDYRPGERTMGPLAAFVHTCDLLSARLWFAHPLAAGDPWAGAHRHLPGAGALGDPAAA